MLMGEYAMGGKSLLYDLTTRVQLIIFDPRARANELVLSIDVPATIAAFGGLAVPASMQDRGLRPLMEDPEIPWRDDIFLESLCLLRTGPFIEAVRTQDWKHVRYFRSGESTYGEEDGAFSGREADFEQPFDLRNDPDEAHNVVAEERNADRVAAFRPRCKDLSAALVRARADRQTYPR